MTGVTAGDIWIRCQVPPSLCSRHALRRWQWIFYNEAVLCDSEFSKGKTTSIDGLLDTNTHVISQFSKW